MVKLLLLHTTFVALSRYARSNAHVTGKSNILFA